MGFLGQRPIIGRPRSEAQLVVRLNQPLPSLVLQMRWILTLKTGRVGLLRMDRTTSGASRSGTRAWGATNERSRDIPITLGRRGCSGGLALRLQRRPNQFRLHGQVNLSRRRGV